MNDSGLYEINSTIMPNSTVFSFNETQPARPTKIQFVVIVPTAIQFVLCSIALVAVIRIPVLRKGQNLFLANLVVADLIGTFVGIWITVISFSDIRHAEVCKTFMAIWHFQFFWLMWGTVLITYNRYSMVAHPFRPGITTRKVAIEIACTCTVGLFIASLPFYTWAKYTLRDNPKKNTYRCGIDHSDFKKYISFRISYFAVFYAIPVILIATFLVMILRRIGSKRSGYAAKFWCAHFEHCRSRRNAGQKVAAIDCQFKSFSVRCRSGYNERCSSCSVHHRIIAA